ncbi:MAG: DUF1015 domain-containing protein [Polyangiaceae bacterium]
MLVAPLDPLCFDATLLPKVVAPPYDVIDAGLRARLAARDPHNIVHLDLPEGDGDARYAHARELFQAWQADGVLRRLGEPAFWRYAQTFDPPGGGARCSRRGFFGLVRAVPFSTGTVLPHERTLSGPKADRIKLSRATRATLSPQFMLYSDPSHSLDPVLDTARPFAQFTTDDGVEHELSRVTDSAAIATISRGLESSRLLIADGHHRYETAVTLADEIDAEARARGPVSELGEHRYTPVFLTNGDDPALMVFPTHRLIHSLPRFDFDTLCQGARAIFEVKPLEGAVREWTAALARAGTSSVCAVAPDGRAALLCLRPDADLGKHPVLSRRPDVLRSTAVALLHDGILEHLLGITPEAQAAKTNIRYLQDASTGVDMLRAGKGQGLFMLNATPIRTIREVAESGEVMPQKSTFFYPKVPTGLLIHTLRPDVAVRAG